MKICFLTQTASDISDYYKSFFKGKDLYFVTFKKENDNALAFVPRSTWSQGRNSLWEQVKNKYDYYVFIDDDLRFFNFKSTFASFPMLAYVYYRLYKNNFIDSFEQSTPKRFFLKLESYLEKFKPEMLSVTQLDNNPVNKLDSIALRKNSFVRRVGFFDAQFTVMSNYAANKVLPYDTSLSGWSSSQIPVYLYAFHVFASKAINVSELAVANSFHVGAYTPDYNGVLDCAKMIDEISKATSRDFSALSSKAPGHAVDYLYGEDVIVNNIPHSQDVEDYRLNYENNLRGLGNLLHSNIEF